jgi:hypothetical protein
MTGLNAALKPYVISSDAANRVALNLLEGATSTINWASGIRIDSSEGNTVLSTNTILSSTINWGYPGAFFAFF